MVMLPAMLVATVSTITAWLIFLGLTLGVLLTRAQPVVWRFYATMGGGYALVYAIDVLHSETPLGVLAPESCPEVLLLYWWAPPVRQAVIRVVICCAVWTLVWSSQTLRPPARETEEE